MDKITDALEGLGAIARLDAQLDVEQSGTDGKRAKPIIHSAYGSRYLFEIESFVKDIEGGWRGGFLDQATRYTQKRIIRELYLGKRYYRIVNRWLERYSDVYRYSTRVEVFYDVCKELGVVSHYPFSFDAPGAVAGVNGVRYMDLFNTMIEMISERCKTREFKERERLRIVNAKRNEMNVLAMEEAMFSEETGRSRWLVLSLTLRYKAKFRRWITPETVQQHRDRFFRARHFNALMSGIRNYVWAIEQGEDTGFHLHVILFYSADHNHDEFIAKQIGEYWVDAVTDGKGDYWNSNDGSLKRSYAKRGHGVGVGQINWNEAGKRDALRKNLLYLAKAEQHLMIKGSENMHTFGTGKLLGKVKAGRPRLDADAGNAGESQIDVESLDESVANATLPREAKGDQIDPQRV